MPLPALAAGRNRAAHRPTPELADSLGVGDAVGQDGGPALSAYEAPTQTSNPLAITV